MRRNTVGRAVWTLAWTSGSEAAATSAGFIEKLNSSLPVGPAILSPARGLFFALVDAQPRLQDAQRPFELLDARGLRSVLLPQARHFGFQAVAVLLDGVGLGGLGFHRRRAEEPECLLHLGAARVDDGHPHVNVAGV